MIFWVLTFASIFITNVNPAPAYDFAYGDISIVEKTSVVISCVVASMPVKSCSWTRTKGQTTVVSQNSSKYTLSGNFEDGDCSLTIHDVSIEEDEGTWTCLPKLRNDQTIRVTAVVTVLVEPTDPRLEYDDKLLSPNSTVILQPDDGLSDWLMQLRCISQLGQPASTLEWGLNGHLIKAKSTDSYPDTRLRTLKAVSSVDIIFSPDSKIINVTCFASHPAYNNKKSVWATFTVDQYPPYVAQIQSGCKLTEESASTGVLTMFQNQIYPLMCLSRANPRPLIEWQMNIDNKWVTVHENTMHHAYFVRDPGNYRCLSSNALSPSKVVSSAVEIQAVSPLRFGRESLMIQHQKEIESREFLIEPRNIEVVAEGSFTLNCKLKTPVTKCMWLLNGKAAREKLSGRASVSKKERMGDCSLHVNSALDGTDNGEWVCQAEVEEGAIVKSRTAKVSVVQPRSAPIIFFRGEPLVNGERILLKATMESSKQGYSKKALLTCVANTHNKYDAITWWINKTPQTFPKTQVKILSENSYQIRSTISLSVKKLPKQIIRPEVFVRCTVNNEGPETVVKIQYPTTKVNVFPCGALYLRARRNVSIYCDADGSPDPELTIEKQVRRHWRWHKTVSNVRWHSLGVTGHYRCTARNKLNTRVLHSKSVTVIMKKKVKKSSANKIKFSLENLILIMLLVHRYCFI